MRTVQTFGKPNWSRLSQLVAVKHDKQGNVFTLTDHVWGQEIWCKPINGDHKFKVSYGDAQKIWPKI